MASESIGSVDTGQMPGDVDWILECYKWAVSYLEFTLGAPPTGCSLGVIWHDHDLGSYPSLGVTWDGDTHRPDEYISKCEELLSRFNRAVDWSLISPESTWDLVQGDNDDA